MVDLLPYGIIWTPVSQACLENYQIRIRSMFERSRSAIGTTVKSIDPDLDQKMHSYNTKRSSSVREKRRASKQSFQSARLSAREPPNATPVQVRALQSIGNILLEPPFGPFLIKKNAFRSTGAERNEKNTKKVPLGNIPNVDTWTEGSIIVKKRPFGTFAIASAFSHSGIGLVNNLDSKKFQTGCQINPPQIKETRR